MLKNIHRIGIMGEWLSVLILASTTEVDGNLVISIC